MSFTHPRRSRKPSASALTLPSTTAGALSVITNMPLRKGATFHSPSTPDHDLPSRTPSPPRRAQSTLEDVVDAYKRRAALTLGDIDRSLAAIEGSSSTRRAFRDESNPLPQGVLDQTVKHTASYGPIMDGAIKKEAAASGRPGLRPRHNRRPSRFSDSGLGSSVGSGSGKRGAQAKDDERTTQAVTASAITRSAAAHSSTLQRLPALSVRASNRIREHILKPLLAKPSLKDFRPIIEDCPRRINAKEIVCLRDLEKTLVFMAPERAKTAALYLDFCLTSIRCIQATVEFLSDREQTRPHDRPYTSGYFVDLVDQIKQYAQQVQAAKEKQDKGEELDEMDPDATDEVKLHGGLTKNGRPAELVRVRKDGKAISIATGLPVDIDEDSKEGVQMKRSLSEEAEGDEAILRSMARRKRSASAAELAPKKCRTPGCDKVFKRSCDLTKHEKTHSRPWKCPVESCKYHEYGWPTEKEMDRHHNDKHSAAPALYECHYKPCPYRSKRESNCKQHMEKAHGWEYVRSKNVGKTIKDKATADVPSNNGLPTPQTTHVQTPSSDGDAVKTPGDDDFDMGYNRSTSYNPENEINFPEYNSDSDIGVFAQPQLQLDYSPVSDELNASSSSEQSPYFNNAMAGQDQFNGFNTSVDFNLYDNEDLYSARVQLPQHSQVFQRIDTSCQYQTSGNPYGQEPVAHISPVGHGNHMLYSPASLREVDEGFDDFIPHNVHRIGAPDFQLYPVSNGGAPGGCSSGSSGTLFGQMQKPPVFPGTTAQELLDFYAASTLAATHGHHNGGMMDWSSDDQYSAYPPQ